MGDSTLIIDYGTVATTATVVGPDGQTTPVLFSGQRWLPSAVRLDGRGKPLPLSPELLPTHDDAVVEQPLRHLLDPTVSVAGRQADPADLVAATLSQRTRW